MSVFGQGRSVPILPSSLPYAPRPVAALLNELSQLNSQLRASADEHRALDKGARAADAQDLEDLSAALRAGSSDPGPKHAEANAAALAAVARRREGLTKAAHRVLGELNANVQESSPAWTTELNAAIAEKNGLIEAAISTLADLLADRAALTSTANFAATVHWKSRPQVINGQEARLHFDSLRRQLLTTGQPPAA
jgi:hypothetical protein